MKAILLTDKDIKDLLTRLDRDPRHGRDGGSSAVLTDAETRAYAEAHRFYNYHIRTWLAEVSQ